MKKSHKYILSVLGLIILGLAYFLLIHKSDLRTAQVKEDPKPILGRALMMQMGKAHGMANWDTISTYTVAFQDEFFGKIGEQSHPYQSPQVEMILDYIPNTYNGRMSFHDGSQWGIQAWKTYIRQTGGEPVFKSDKDITFWLPTYQYFIELPYRIQSASVVAYAGEKTIDGRVHEGIFASWDKYKPQSDIDQYLIWIDKETKIVKEVEYTVRDMFGFMTGKAHYQQYQDFGGIQIATRMPVDAPIGEGYLHQMGINGIQFDMIPKEDLLPDVSLPFVGDAKADQIEN